MRTYLIDDENQYIIDLVKVIKHSSELFEFHYSTLREHKVADQRMVYVRKLGGSYFGSFDKKRWEKLARQELPKKILNVNKVYDVYKGYRPSGLIANSLGGLKTQMPGKVVKILVQENDRVRIGQTLVILEAMKMENEIKANISGIAKKIHVKLGDTLKSGVVMIELKTSEIKDD